MRRIEKQKRLSAQLILDNFAKNTPEHIFWKDLSGVYLGCNDKQAKTLGFKSANEIIGKTDFELPWSKETMNLFRKNDLYVIKTGTAITVEETITIDNCEMTVYSLKAPIKDAKGNIYGILGISIDITDRKRAEERAKLALIHAEKEKMQAATEAELRRASTILAGSIAHDLRTPLTALSLHIDLLQKIYCSLSKKKYSHEHKTWDVTKIDLEYIEKFTLNMKKIINEMNQFIHTTLKSLHRVVTGTLSNEDFILCEIEPCLYDVFDKYPFKRNEKKLIHLEKIDNFLFIGYPLLFYRILFNILNNALQQISLAGRGEIFITTENTSTHSLLRIKDTAGGVSAEIKKHLFDGFYTTKKEGSGVGLAFCKLTMQSFGGDIVCDSVEGEYIEFTLSFPILKT